MNYINSQNKIEQLGMEHMYNGTLVYNYKTKYILLYFCQYLGCTMPMMLLGKCVCV